MMNQQKAIQPKKEDELQREDLIREVLKGSPSGMDQDSVFAAATLLLEVETNRAIIRSLQTRELHGWLDEEGEVSLCVCGSPCNHTTKTEAA